MNFLKSRISRQNHFYRFAKFDEDILNHKSINHDAEPPAVAIVRQNGLSSASSRASVADTPVSRQIWWTQVVDGLPQVRLHSCEGRSPSLVLTQIRRIEFAELLRMKDFQYSSFDLDLELCPWHWKKWCAKFPENWTFPFRESATCVTN